MKEHLVENCRMAFHIRCEMFKEVKRNFKDKHCVERRRKGGEQALKCDGDHVQTQAPCLVCPPWDYIRRGLDFFKIWGMVTFFKRLLME